MDHETRHRRDVLSHLPWRDLPEDMRAEQEEWQAFLQEEYDMAIGEDAFVATDAVVSLPEGEVGDRTIVASGAIVRGDVTIGADCSVNPYVNIAGEVTIGDGVRVASTASIWGENHVHEDTETPIYKQGNRYEGVEIGDDAWIGAGAVVVDGVTVAPHTVVAAGAIVTDDVPEYALVAGNPATVVRDRRESRSSASDTRLADRLARFGERVDEQVEAVVEHYHRDRSEGGRFLDRPDADPTVRAWCDAIEITGMFERVPPGYEREELAERLRGLQDPETGLLPEPGQPPDEDADPATLPASWKPYNVLAVGYALEVLDSTFAHPVSAVEDLSPEALYDHLNGLPWDETAWGCGAWIDHYATALYFNRRYFGGERSPASVVGWLGTTVDPDTGLWGEPTASEDWLQPVNGFYRLARGTYAQFGLDVPFPEATIDTVLRHGRNPEFFRVEQLNACNTLDVIHPLWLCGQGTEYRRDEVQEWARTRIGEVLDRWHDDRGFAFRLDGDRPSLQGTEMWLSILYLLADVCGLSHELGYEPRGVHRTESALHLRRE